jgi:hypothetical protein
MNDALNKTTLLVALGLTLLVFGAAGADTRFSSIRETNRVHATDKFLGSDTNRADGSRQVTITASNLLESFKEMPNWPAIGAGDVTTAQLNTASNAVWTLMTNHVTITSNSLWTAIANLQGATNGLHTLVQALLSQTNSLGNRIAALEAASSGGSSNMPVAALGTLFVTNRLARGATNLVTDTPAWRLDGPGYAWMSLTGNTMINIVAPAADTTFTTEGLLELVTTGAPPASVILSNAIAMNTLVLRPGTNNLFRVLWNRTNVLVWSLQDLTTGSGAVVLSNAPTIVNATLVTPILPAILTNQSSSVIGTVAGVGGANTNFTFNWQGPADLHIDAGTTNVNIVAVMNWLAGQSQVINVLFTNRTGTPRKISASAETNNWIGLGTITLPIDITNAVYLSIKSLGGSNTVYGARYCSNPTN